ncbi:putative porin [Fulvivirgaceae bacterium LMO-SS25]
MKKTELLKDSFSVFLTVNLKHFLVLFFILVLGLAQNSFGQILNDSAQSVYGPKTTTYTTGKAIRLSDIHYQPVDTSMHAFHRFQKVHQLGNKYQDLGNHGTAMWPIFFEMPTTVGISSGYNAYDLYFKDKSKIKYFDTKSPYTNLAPVFAGAGRSLLDIDFSRNVSEYWNVGFNFNTIRMDKQLAAAGRGDRNVESNSYDIYTHYRDSSERYQAVAFFSRMSHGVSESGGIIPPEVNEESEYFLYRDSRVYLSNGGSQEVRQNYHLYQEYMLKPLFGIFTEFDRQNQVVKFLDGTSGSNEFNYYPEYIISTSLTADRSKMSQTELTGGVKGKSKNLFYSFYYKNRNLVFQPKYLDESRFIEHYVGTDLRWEFDSLFRIEAGGEYTIEGNYRLEGKLSLFNFEAEAKQTLSAPNMLQRQYLGNHYAWENSFSNQFSNQLNLGYRWTNETMMIKPKVSFTSISNYIYFNQMKVPEQATGNISMLSPGIDFSINFWENMNFNAEVIYSKVAGESADKYRLPTYFSNGQLYYLNNLFNGKLTIQTGIDLHYKSAWFANGYDPITQQYHLQNEFEIPSYVWADFFINFKINRTRIFMKLTHLNQGLMAEDGYFVTPYYTGMPRIFDLGLSWMFFD